MSIFESNLAALKSRFPELAARIESFPAKDSVVVFKARDGSTCYGIRDGNNVTPIMDHVAPLARIQSQLDAAAKQISDYTRPVLIVGLYPGNEVLGIFDQCESNTSPHAPQQVCVCIDSTIALYAFLKTWDATRVINSPRVRFFWHEDMPQFVEHLRKHPEIPHIFTLITGANEETLNQVMPPLVQLINERDTETERLKAENNAYYDSISDKDLASIVAGHPQAEISNSSSSGLSPQSSACRRPRLMMPTCSWSTFIQHSTRDTCAEFGDMGWETRILKMEAMLTPYYLVSSIHEFKPDVFLFIDHLRSEAEQIYPDNMMFVTWIQDEMSHLFCAEAGRKLAEYARARKRDLVIGYNKQWLVRHCEYPEDRLVPIHIPANPRVFHPMQLSDVDNTTYGCDLAFMSNVSRSSERLVDEVLVPSLEEYGIDRNEVQEIHDHLWSLYREGRTLGNRTAFLTEMLGFDAFAHAYRSTAYTQESILPRTREQHELMRLFFWKLNDVIYRHVVLEWAHELGADMHLYGHGWEEHPRFSKYARGPVEHGSELNKAYQGAHWNLHLNITQSMHQRVWEILSAGARPLCREREPSPNPRVIEPPRKLMCKVAPFFMNKPAGPDQAELERQFTEQECVVFTDYLFQHAYQQAKLESGTGLDETRDQDQTAALENKVVERVREHIMSRPDWLLPEWEQYNFRDKQTFQQRLKTEN